MSLFDTISKVLILFLMFSLICPRKLEKYSKIQHKNSSKFDLLMSYHEVCWSSPYFSADCLVHNRVSPLRRRLERRPHRVPNEPRPVPSHSLPPGHLRSRHFRREGLPRTTDSCRDHQRLLRAGQSVGEVRSEAWKVHGVLYVVQVRFSWKDVEV